MSRWREQVAPVLEAVDRADERALHERGMFLGYDGARELLALDMDDTTIHEALLLLRDVNYVSFAEEPESNNSVYIQNLRITGDGKQALGEWPRFELLLTPTNLAAMLDMLAEQADSDEERNLFKQAADYVRTASPQMIQSAGVAVGVQLARAAFGF